MDFFKPQKYMYEPIALQQQRKLAAFDTMRDQISPLVAKGDPFSLFKARQVVQQAKVPKEAPKLAQHSFLSKIGDDVRKRIADAQANQQALAGAPDNIQVASDQMGHPQTPSRPIPGVVAGVAAAFPETQGSGPVYNSGTASGSSVLHGLGAIAKDTGAGVLEQLQRPRGAIAGAAENAGGNPISGAIAGFQNPSAHTFSNVGGIKNLGDANYTAGLGIGGESIGAKLGLGKRDIAGGILDTVTDPTNWIGAGESLKGLRGASKADEIGAAVKEADPIAARVAEAVQQKFRPQAAPVMGGAERTGNRLLQLPDTEQLTSELGHAPNLKDIFNVDRLGRREATAQGNKLRAQATLDFRALGPTVKDAKGNLLVRGIAPDNLDIARGQEFAPLVKVIEKPDNYALTPDQAQAVQRLAQIPELVKNERAAFNVGVHALDVPEGEQFIWRKAKTTTKGVETNSARPTAGGSRLGGGGDKGRVFENIDDALDAGVVYSHPQEAFDQNVLGGLKKSVDEHVKSLYVPMSDSAANRVPPGLRAQNDSLTRRLTSLKGTLGRLDARTRSIVDAYIHSATPDLDALHDELAQVSSRSGKLPPEVSAELNQTMSDIRAVRPEWRRAIRMARNVPAGRATVPMDIAPALNGRDFEPQVAQKIEDYYRHTARIPLPGGKSISLKADIPAMRAASSVVTPIRATGDLSAIMMNQVTNVARHPLTFAKNVALGMRDLVADTPYEQWLSSGDANDGARHGLAIIGGVGDKQEFQFSNWMSRVPGLKQLDEHYVRFNNRQRVDLYNLEVRARGGAHNIDAQAKEQIARAINRFTGVSNSRATDAETLASFAPNFTRAHIETIASALSNGSIEGSMAREYLATMLGAGSALVAGAALAQGRDPREVLQPFKMDDLKQGHIRLNPNFMSVRAFGQDVKIFGKYDSLMRLATIMSDSAVRSIGERDAMQLFDAVGYMTGGMGSPVASFLTSLVKGETFTGQNPLSLGGIASNLTPFTAPQIAGQVRGAAGDVMNGDLSGAANQLGAAGVNFLGGKASPVTAKEQLDIATQRQFGVDYGQTNKDQRHQIQSLHPDLVIAYERGARGKTLEAQKIKDEYSTLQENRDEGLLSGAIPRQDYVNQYYDDLNAKRAKLEVIYGKTPITKPKNPLEHYIQILQNATDPKTNLLDHDKVDAGMATLTAADRKYISDHVGMDDTALTAVFRDVRATRSERNALPKYAGFDGPTAQKIDDTWQEVRNLSRNADQLNMLRALRQYLASNPDLDPAVVSGVRRRINGVLRTTPARANFDKAHPEAKIFYGAGKLTAADQALLKSLIDQKTKKAA